MWPPCAIEPTGAAAGGLSFAPMAPEAEAEEGRVEGRVSQSTVRRTLPQPACDALEAADIPICCRLEAP